MPVINCTEQVESIDRSVRALGGQIPDTSPVVLTTGRQRYSAQEGQAGAYLRARNKYPNFCRFATRRKKPNMRASCGIGDQVRAVLGCHTRLSTMISPLHPPASDSDMCPTTVPHS